MFICFNKITSTIKKDKVMIRTYNRISHGSSIPKGSSVKRYIKAQYFTNKSPNTAPAGAPKLPLLTRIKKFFTSLINANKGYFTK